MSKLTVHMIGNAHLDPVWQWSYQAGIDEALATAYSALNLLREYDEFIFTRSDVWFHQIIETLAPDLFAEVKRYVSAGRWQIVGGWYIQPDCNLPTEFAFRKHIEIGRRYFREKFGATTTVGYNVDSFGHAGTLPRILNEAGYTSYVFMRPAPQEKILPDAVFRWRAADSEHEVIGYRIWRAYTCAADDLRDHIMAAVESGDNSLGHIMCFYGVGDHGGGPTRRQIEFILDHKDAFNGMELIFSHPAAYFDAISDKIDLLPIVPGELQYHAVGCYSVLRKLKSALRRAEHKLTQAQSVTEQLHQHAAPDAQDKLARAWEDVLFNQFHDTYDGTCLKSAYPDVFDQIGRASAEADQLTTAAIRRYSTELTPVELSDSALAYLAILNTHDDHYEGYIEHEFHGLRDAKTVLVDEEASAAVPSQTLPPEASDANFLRLLIPVHMKPREMKLLKLTPVSHDPGEFKTEVATEGETISNAYWQVTGGDSSIELHDRVGGKVVTVSWQVQDDLSDTWSHGITGYRGETLGQFTKKHLLLEESGPIRASSAWLGGFEQSALRVRTRLYPDDPFVELMIDLFWAQPKAILKMVVQTADTIAERWDGIPGGRHRRELDGNEHPFHDWTLLNSPDNTGLAIVSGDVYGFDVTSRSVRLTMVRSPRYCIHRDDVPAEEDPRQFHTDFIDQGEHQFRVLMRIGGVINPLRLQKIAYQLHQPPIHWDPPYRKNYP